MIGVHRERTVQPNQFEVGIFKKHGDGCRALTIVFRGPRRDGETSGSERADRGAPFRLHDNEDVIELDAPGLR